MIRKLFPRPSVSTIAYDGCNFCARPIAPKPCVSDAAHYKLISLSLSLFSPTSLLICFTFAVFLHFSQAIVPDLFCLWYVYHVTPTLSLVDRWKCDNNERNPGQWCAESRNDDVSICLYREKHKYPGPPASEKHSSWYTRLTPCGKEYVFTIRRRSSRPLAVFLSWGDSSRSLLKIVHLNNATLW